MGELVRVILTIAMVGAFISSILFILVRASGCWLLARSYAASAPFRGTLWRFSSARLGQTHFGSTLTLGSSTSGLYIASVFPLSLGFKPLLIPWENVAVSLKKLWFYEYWEFHFGDLPKPTLQVGKSLGQELIKASLQKDPPS